MLVHLPFIGTFPNETSEVCQTFSILRAKYDGVQIVSDSRHVNEPPLYSFLSHFSIEYRIVKVG